MTFGQEMRHLMPSGEEVEIYSVHRRAPLVFNWKTVFEVFASISVYPSVKNGMVEEGYAR